MIIPPIRGRDRKGSGYYGAPRGTRVHQGVDFVKNPGEAIHAFSPGIVTKLGYPYADDLSFQYVEVQDEYGSRCRYFYCVPDVLVGWRVGVGDVLGTCQSLRERYPGITEHYHFEVISNGVHIDPLAYLGEL